MGYHRERNRCEIDREGEKEMTRKEKVAEMMPEAMNKVTVGGVKGCPHHYPFLNIGKDGSECLIHDITRSGSELFSKCTKMLEHRMGRTNTAEMAAGHFR